ncbi:hypothetical protein AGMMS49593_01790 [Endomicrobiia bacterium]|nr:hypothetical protein AGMMS49593_01790 [Endomicrobiia bacterium]
MIITEMQSYAKSVESVNGVTADRTHERKLRNFTQSLFYTTPPLCYFHFLDTTFKSYNVLKKTQKKALPAFKQLLQLKKPEMPKVLRVTGSWGVVPRYKLSLLDR